MKIFGLIKELFFTGLAILSNFASINSFNAIPLSCISMSNQEYRTRTQVANVNGDEPVFFPFSIKRSKCSGRGNNINYPYAKICVADIIKDLNLKLSNLMSRINETKQQNGMKRVNVNLNLDKMFVMLNNVGIKINVDVNAKN